jgi:hypothetical protein
MWAGMPFLDVYVKKGITLDGRVVDALRWVHALSM